MAPSRFAHRFTFGAAALALLLFASDSMAALFGHKWDDDRLTLVSDKSRTQGEWHAGISALNRSRVPSGAGVNIEIREGNSTWGFYLPTERGPLLEQKAGDGDHVHFTITADSGNLQFDGVAKGKSAEGHYVFEPNKQFAADAGKLLKTRPTDDDLLKFAFARITLAYIRGVTETLPSATPEEIVRLRNFGLEPDAIKAFFAAGFSKVEDLTRLRSFGVTPDYATKVRAAGYGKTAEEVTRLRSFGVTTDDLVGWKNAGFALSTDEVVKMHSFGVQPDYGAAWKKAGFDLNPEGLIHARNFGVPVDFAAAVASTKPKPSLEEIVRMRQFGITADYFREVKQYKPNYTVAEIIRLRQFGVMPDYLKAVGGSRNDFTAEQIIKLRNFGVPAEYVAALNVPDRKPLDADAIIDLRNRGVSAEAARKLRE
jgi:hypothetical protein